MHRVFGFFLRSRRRIGARLYLALALAVLLTLLSSGLGVYYFERSGDVSHRLRSGSYPAAEASWEASRHAERLSSLGTVARSGGDASGVGEVLSSLDSSLSRAAALPSMSAAAPLVQEEAYRLSGIIDRAVVAHRALADSGDRLESASADYRELASASVGSASPQALGIIPLMLLSDSQADLDGLWASFSSRDGLSEAAASLGRRAYESRARGISAQSRLEELSAELSSSRAALDSRVDVLLRDASAASRADLGATVAGFDQGRALLAGVSVTSVVFATLTAWLWVGNGLVRPLTRLSERMRGMAQGDLATPVPGVGDDEIGELARALEVFRAQAYEVERLNLVEQLYGELREANEELQRMQARLVAQEKLAALGELVSGVAHEISNPLNFVQNFAEGVLEMYEELTGVLRSYEDTMSDGDRQLLEDLKEDISDSLSRIRSNGGRALAIVERMRSFGVSGGNLSWVDLNGDVRGAVEVALDSFRASNPDFQVQVDYRLDPQVGEVELVEGDFGNSVVNLVSNACHAMLEKVMLEKRDGLAEGSGDGYAPLLLVSTWLEGDGVHVVFRDNGTGISDAVLPKIFNPFFTTREGTLGAGLGLPIAGDVVRRAGGTMTVDTVAGEFAEFAILLPKGEPVAATLLVDVE